MATRVTKAVIPAAGLGTRFLPATKAVPKELLPVVDVPAIEYVVAEAAAAGLDDIVMVSNRGKTLLEDHFDRAPEIEAVLEKKGDKERLARVQRSSELATVHFVRQGEARGLGHAVLCGAHHVGDQRFAVLLGDDLIDERDPVLPRMLELQEKYGGSVMLLMEVPKEQTHLYGCAAVEPGDGDVLRITDLIEKPDPAEAPSNLAVIGRYVLDPAVFDVLRETPPGRGGEIQLTDALRTLATRSRDDGGPVHGLIFRGRRYDTGDRADYLKAVVRLACERDDLGPEFRAWLAEFVQSPEGRV
ncbi:MAG: UTP--glucose-phosphate uridylyltransferase [Frankiales bacterium]|jgi:UTP--glucose-1-phosphate uridylyltransferase|nr:UTP--glucose-phosphate uridylyltransferase [Frankiales bacterium]